MYHNVPSIHVVVSIDIYWNLLGNNWCIYVNIFLEAGVQR